MGSNPIARSQGDVAKWQGKGLQNPHSPVQIRPSPHTSGSKADSNTHFCYQPLTKGRWRKGRRCGLKIRWRQLHEGSTPSRPMEHNAVEAGLKSFPLDRVKSGGCISVLGQVTGLLPNSALHWGEERVAEGIALGYPCITAKGAFQFGGRLVP